MSDAINTLADAIRHVEAAEVRVARADSIAYRGGKDAHEASHLREAVQQYRLAVDGLKSACRELYRINSTTTPESGTTEN